MYTMRDNDNYIEINQVLSVLPSKKQASVDIPTSLNITALASRE